MAKVMAYEAFILRRAQTETGRAMTELQQALGTLQAAMRPMAAQCEGLKAKLDRAMRWRECEEADHQDLQQSFEEAIAAASLAELEAARDAYALLMAKHKERRAARKAL
ncbi:MAG: hypothetical protein HZC25_08030 [Rhodospirillales bacterium]|nr:hypothetical protein [Rhodospirillales bacterium]